MLEQKCGQAEIITDEDVMEAIKGMLEITTLQAEEVEKMCLLRAV